MPLSACVKRGFRPLSVAGDGLEVRLSGTPGEPYLKAAIGQGKGAKPLFAHADGGACEAAEVPDKRGSNCQLTFFLLPYFGIYFSATSSSENSMFCFACPHTSALAGQFSDEGFGADGYPTWRNSAVDGEVGPGPIPPRARFSHEGGRLQMGLAHPRPSLPLARGNFDVIVYSGLVFDPAEWGALGESLSQLGGKNDYVVHLRRA